MACDPRRQHPSVTRDHHRGFTAIELLVVIGVILVLLSIFIPYLSSIRESSRRAQCAANLMLIRDGLAQYAQMNGQAFPRVVYDAERNPDGYVAYTAAEAADPFAPDTAVLPNDVTASLWLLVRNGLVGPEVFVCPSSGDQPDPSANPRRRSNFASADNLSYSYSSPFSSAAGYRMSADFLPGGFAVAADMNPGRGGGGGDDVTGPAHDAPAREMARANSNNHNGAGQNVLYADGHVAFEATPYSGVEGDNIYTALAASPLQPGSSPPANGRGFTGRSVAPAWNGDSYLVPTDDEMPMTGDVQRPVPTTAPATTAPSTQPASTTR